MDVCPICKTPYGKRKRCYRCEGEMRRAGETRSCGNCGKDFYVPRWKFKDEVRNQGTYCSPECHHQAMKGRPFKPDGIKRYIRKDGYVAVKVGVDRWELEHRGVMAEQLGRPLRDDEQVHHKDHDRTHNDPENLEIVAPQYHPSLHPQKPKRVAITCQECGKVFEVKPSKVNSKDPKNQRKYCSLACRYKAWGRKMHPA